MQRHHWARIRVSCHLLGDILIGNWSDVCKGSTAPADIKVIGVDQPTHAIGAWFYAICESSTFKSVMEGAEIPEIEPFEYTTEPADAGGKG